MEAAGLTVSINGDASGLLGAVESAKAGLASLETAAEAVRGLDGFNASVTITAVDNATETVRGASAAVTAFSGLVGRAMLSAVDNTGPAVASAKANIASVRGKTVTISVNYVTTGARPKARGTKSFEGGLALVNDERGVSDPREMIVDRGMAFIPEGRDVVLPLSKGARVYTAAQTRSIMTALGIPNYAGGKDNSDEFKIAEADIRHYTKSRAVTNAEELERWAELSARFTENLADAEDIEENIFSLTRKIADELNEESVEYLKDRAYFNDFWINGDSPVDSFERVRERNLGYFEDGVITWKEYCDTIEEIGSEMYRARLDNSYDWLEQERGYNDLSSEEYIAGLERMRAYTEEYYANGIISLREYCEGIRGIENALADEREAVRKAENEALLDGADELLSAQKDYIKRAEEAFENEEKALKDRWDAEDRRADIAETGRGLDAYRNAVTERGQARYRELQEQMKKLRREEEMYRLERENNSVIAALREDYEVMENNKNAMIAVIKDSGINVEGVVESINAGLSGVQDIMRSIAASVVNAINSKDFGSTTYSDRRTINVTAADGVMIKSLISRGGSAMARGAYY